MIRSRAFLAVIAALPLLSACGSDKAANPLVKVVADTARSATGSQQPQAAARPAVTRASLSKFKTPMILAEIPSVGFYTFVVPYGQNGDIETWASTDDRTIAFRQGMVIGTRGFGPDILQSAGPSVSQVASGSGSYDRAYYYVDGADQTQRFNFRCTLSVLGTDTITVVDRQHTTRHVAETCTGESGDFVNEYWFENGVFLRKSKQLINVEWGPLVLSRVIDNG